MKLERNQQGAAILILITIVLLATTTLLVTELSVNGVKNERTENSASVLGVANQALIGFALESSTPGSLPCPDSTGDGLANPSGLSCASQLGLLPYRTLNIPQLVDGAAAALWYAVSLNYTANALANKNSSTLTDIQLDGIEMAAVIIAPGAALDGQNRVPLNRTDFLEGINADANFSDYENRQSANSNDEVLGIPAERYWSIIERRVLIETSQLLSNYRAQCGEYPWAANFGGPYNSVDSQQTGSLPLNAASPTDWGSVCGANTAPTPATWLTNNWSDQLFYAMCTSGDGSCLTVIGASPGSAVVLGPGVTLGGQARPSASVTQYFELENIAAPDTQYQHTTLINHTNTYNDTTATLVP